MVITGNKGGSQRPPTPTESPDSLHSTAKAKILLALGEGEFAGELDGTRIYLDGTPLNNADGSANFTGVTWDYRPGTPSQDYITGMPNVENEVTVNTELKADTPWVRAISNTQLSALRIRFSWPALQRQTDNGDVNGTRVEYEIEMATDGGAYHTVLKTTVEGKTSTGYQRSHRINLPDAKTGWQLRVRRLTPNSTSNRLADNMHIEALAEIIDAKLRYPNTALLYIEFDASQFQHIPVIACEPKMRTIRVPTTYDPATRTYKGTWDGTFKWAYSNNPAWVFYDILLADRFGLGHRLTAAQVDKWELYRIAQYCDQFVPDGKGGNGTEPRFLCDVYIQSQAEAFTVLRDLAAIFRGMTYWANNQLCALADMPRDRDYLYTRANVIDGRFSYSSSSEKSRYSTAMVSWSDPANSYQGTLEAVSDEALVRRYGINQLSTTAIGCVRQTEAHRRGRWALLTNAKDRLVTFDVGLDGAIPLPGHIIAVADEMLSGRKSGGRLRHAVGCDITLERPADVKPGDRLLVNLPSGTAQARTVHAVNGQLITVSVAYSETPQPEAIWSVEADDVALQHYRVTRIEDNNDNTYRINAVQHDPDKYERIDSGTRLDERPISVIPLTLQPPPTHITLTSHAVIAQGLAVTTLQVNWQAASGATAYDAQWRRDKGNWTPLLRVLTCGFEVPNSYAGCYQARVRAINATGSTSLWVTTPEIPLQGKENPPPQPVGLTTTPIVFGITLNWAFPAGAEDTLKTEVECSRFAHDAHQKPLIDIAYPQRHYTMQGLAAGRTFYFRARLVDRLGNQGAWTPWVQGASSDDAEMVLDHIRDDIMTTQAGKRLTSQLDTLIKTSQANERKQEHSRITLQKEVKDRVEETLLQVNERLERQDKTLQRYNQGLKSRFKISQLQTQDVQKTATHLDTAFITYKEEMDTQFDRANADVLAVRQAQSDTHQAFSLYRLDMTARFDKNDALITDIHTAHATATQALADYQNRIAARFGKNETAISQTQRAQTLATQALAEYQNMITARFRDNDAVIETKATTQFTSSGGNALYSIKAGIHHQGKYYDAGMVVGVETQGGSVKSQIGFNADNFILLSGQNGKKFSPFAVKNNQVFIREGFIQDATIDTAKIKEAAITNTKIGGPLQSTNWAAGRSGWKIEKAGHAEFNDATFRGTIYATDGWFKGTVSADKIEGDILDMSPNFFKTKKGSIPDSQSVIFPLFYIKKTASPRRVLLLGRKEKGIALSVSPDWVRATITRDGMDVQYLGKAGSGLLGEYVNAVNEDIDITLPAGEGEVLIGLRLQSTRGKLRMFNWTASGDIYTMKNAASIKIA